MSSIGMNGRGPYTNDLIKACQLCIGAYQAVCAPHISASSGWRNASEVGMTADGIPTTFPIGTEDLFLLIPYSEAVSWRAGTYDVTFTPGLEWDFSGSSSAVRTAYNSAAGTATIVWNPDLNSQPRFFLRSYNGVARTLPASTNFYFRAFKQGANTSKLVAAEYKAGLAPFAGGYIRMMETFSTNRAATAGIIYNPITALFNNNSLTWTNFSIPPVDALIEIAAECSMIPWVNTHDLMTDAAITAMANRVLSLWSGPFALEYSNELWNFGLGFIQTYSLNDRSNASGIPMRRKYAQEFANVIALFDAVFAGQTSKVRPIACWQGGTNAGGWAEILNEGNLYQRVYGCGISNYVNDIGDYNATAILSKAERDLVLTDAAAYKTAVYNAMVRENNTGVFGISFLTNFVNVIRNFCASKGLPRSAIRTMHYEAGHTHTIEANTPTASNQQNLTRQALAELHRDPRIATIAIEQMRRFLDADVDAVYFDYAGEATAAALQYGIWTVMDNVTATTQEPYASMVAWLANPPVLPKLKSAQGILT